MVGGGFTIQGSYHDKNQDSYWVGAVSGGYIVALSDGLGSCKYSEIGSQTFCEVVRELADSLNCQIHDTDVFLKQVEEDWKISIRHKLYKIEDCHATALFAVIGNKDTWFFRLGDGVLGVKFDKGATVLCDLKEDGYLNITDCLGISSMSWEKYRVPTANLQGIFICSDGVTDDNDKDNLIDLIEGIYTEYGNQSKKEIEEDLSLWVPTMKSRDDKTVAFLFNTHERMC